MRSISTRRKLVEEEGHHHAVKRGWRWKLHFENFPLLVRFFSFLLSISFTKATGMRNAMDVKLNEVSYAFKSLPVGFDNTRILLVTDLHVDGMDGLTEIITATLRDVDYDLCILGGDYSFGFNDDHGLVFKRMKTIAEFLVSKSKVFGVLGNHDKYEIGQLLSECSVEMLLNETVCIEKGSDKIHIAGLDDVHYYGADDLELADKDITDGAFKIMICHSPAISGSSKFGVFVVPFRPYSWRTGVFAQWRSIGYFCNSSSKTGKGQVVISRNEWLHVTRSWNVRDSRTFLLSTGDDRGYTQMRNVNEDHCAY